MSINKRVCLVTGANSGIGKEIAFGLASAGAHVIMVCRDVVKGQAAQTEIKAATGSTAIDLLIADLSSQAEVRSLAKTLYERYSTLNVVIHNAGLVLKQKSYSVDGIEMTLATNYLAPFQLNNLLMDLLKKSAPSRIINVSSAIHKWAKMDLDDLQYKKRNYRFMKAYAQSKLLMNISTFELARRLQDTSVTINCIHPGAVKTNLGSSSANNLILKYIDKLIKFFFITPSCAAKAIIDLALSKNFENTTGKYFIKNKIANPSHITKDPEIAKQLWKISKNLVT